MSLTLYHMAPSRSSTVHWLLEELGEPYELKLLSMEKGENRKPDYLAINPMGKVPTLVHDGVAITESAAICLYLADAFPRAGLTVPVGDPRRGPFLKWIMFTPSCLEGAMMDRAFPRKDEAPKGALGYGDAETVLDVVAKALTPGPFLFGDSFTVADLVLGSTLSWGMMFKLVPERPEFTAFAQRIAERPAFRRAKEKDKVLAGG